MVTGQVGRMLFSRILEDEDLAEAIRKRAKENGTRAGVFMLIGSLKNAVLGYLKEGEYKFIKLDGPLEIASCMGNISVDEKGDIMIHAHVVVSNEKGEVFGGHLMKESYVGATAELVVIEGLGVELKKAWDAKTKLNLWKLG